MSDWQRRSGSIEERGRDAADAPFACPLCGEADRPGGPYCAHVVCAFEPRIAPEHRRGADEPRPHCLVRFRSHAAPTTVDDVERLCTLLSEYARSEAEGAARESLPDPLAQLVELILEREDETGDGLYAVSCSALDLYLGRLYRDAPGFAGGEVIERSALGTLSNVLYRVYFAADPKAAAAHAAERIARDIESTARRLSG